MQTRFTTNRNYSRRTMEPGRLGRYLGRPGRKSVLGVLAVGALMCAGVAASALPHAFADPIAETVAIDGQNSALANRLVDGETGPTEAHSWSNATNEWRDTYYPMEAVIDLGADYDVSAIRYFAGEIPYPKTASLVIEGASSAQPDHYLSLATDTSPQYDQWSSSVPVNDIRARYVRVRFDTVSSHFKLAELEVFGRSTDGSSAEYLMDVTAVDEQNSIHADRLVDGVNPPGTTSAVSWLNPQPWSESRYPMSAVLDLGGSYALSQIDYFVGEISEGQDKINFEFTNEQTPTGFTSLATVSSGHRWDKWSSISLDGQKARFVKVRFDGPYERFNLSEIRIGGQSVSETPAVAADVVSGNDDMVGVIADGSQPISNDSVIVGSNGETDSSDQASSTDPSSTQPSGGESDGQSDNNGEATDDGDEPKPAVPPGHEGHDHDHPGYDPNDPDSYVEPSDHHDDHTDHGSDDSVVTDAPAAGTPVLSPTQDLPQATTPPADVKRSFQFGTWPGDHLSASCRELHDRYWVVGPDGAAYPTWHPALITNPETGEVCDIGHEHGTDPSVSPLFARSGGWPAFGYAAAEAAAAGGHRHEDHVGHKVSVANFRAAIGNTAGSETLYDAGFDCEWLSKIHQGSFSMDAFANHLHEYFLTLRCQDGLNSSGVMDGKTVGTDFSVKVVYTYGNPDEFVEKSCSGADQTYPASILTGPDGKPGPTAMQQTPVGLDAPNNRGFSCASGVMWKPMSEVREVDLWTELVKIQGNDGQTALTIQPYYQIKNPARIIAPFDGSKGEQPSQVLRTIDICYDDAGQKISKYQYCADAPQNKPADWSDPASPFNGTLRAINFKSSSLQNGGGPAEFCTNAFGRQVQDSPPCERGNILQKASSFNNNWNNGKYAYGNHSGQVAGSIWARSPYGERFESKSNGSGGYDPVGIGFEFVIDNRDPDDNFDGKPDGANIRGRN